MGLFDGLASRTDGESTAQVAGLLRAPVVLVVDVAAMGQSAAALVHGFRSYDELLWLGGVVLTRVLSSRHEHLLREALADIGVPVLGALRRGDLAALGRGGGRPAAREHGLAPPCSAASTRCAAVRRLGELVGRRGRPGPAAGARPVRAAAVRRPVVAGGGRRSRSSAPTTSVVSRRRRAGR